MKQKIAIGVSLLFPGLGQIVLGRAINGLFLLAVYGFFVLLGVFRVIACETPSVFDDRLFCLALGAAGTAWVCSLIETLQFGLERKALGTEADRDAHIRKGVVSYLKGEFGRAAEEYRKALALDRNDTDARFHLAMALKAQGSHRRARRTLKQCLALDPDTKWYADIHDELENLRS